MFSVSSSGVQGNGGSAWASISGNGRFVVFASEASNLVPGDTNGLADIFLHDRDADADGIFDEAGAVAVTRLNVGPGGVEANGFSTDPAITPDARFVCFVSTATSLMGGSPPGIQQIYRLDRLTGGLERVSVTAEGRAGGEDSTEPAMSDDGRVVAFRSRAQLTPASVSTFAIFIRDLAAGTTLRATWAFDPSDASNPTISADGRRVIYQKPGVLEIYDGPRDPALTPRWVGSGVQSYGMLTAPGTQAIYAKDGRLVRRSIAIGTEESMNASTGNPPIVASPSGRYVLGREGQVYDFDQIKGDVGSVSVLASTVIDGAFDRQDRWLALTTTSGSFAPGGADTNGLPDVFVVDLHDVFDQDADGLNNLWETLYNTSDPAADPDGDGATNAQEFAAGTHPTGTVKRYLAEGATGGFFRTAISLANPDPAVDAAVQLTFDRFDGVRIRRAVSVPASRSVSIELGGIPGLEQASISTAIESDRPIGVARTMRWDTLPLDFPVFGYGSTMEVRCRRRRRRGSSPRDRRCSASSCSTCCRTRRRPPRMPPCVSCSRTARSSPRTYDLAPRSRTTVYVNQIPGLEATDVSGDISSDVPIVVERAMYRSLPGQPFGLGTASSGVTAAATRWFLAEGATGAFFDLYVLIANPGAADAVVEAVYAKPDGTTVTRQYTVRAHSRFSVYVESIPGLENTPVATTVTSTNAVPIVVERAMYLAGRLLRLLRRSQLRGQHRGGAALGRRRRRGADLRADRQHREPRGHRVDPGPAGPRRRSAVADRCLAAAQQPHDRRHHAAEPDVRRARRQRRFATRGPGGRERRLPAPLPYVVGGRRQRAGGADPVERVALSSGLTSLRALSRSSAS